MDEIRAAILSGEPGALAGLLLPESYRGVVVRADEVRMFEGLPTRDKDPRQSLHLEDVPTPDIGPGEAIVAVMASAINYNTVWTSIFEPLPTFAFLRRYAKTSEFAAKHDQPFHVVGSDLAGVVLRVGPGVTRWQTGDEVAEPAPRGGAARRRAGACEETDEDDARADEAHLWVSTWPAPATPRRARGSRSGRPHPGRSG